MTSSLTPDLASILMSGKSIGWVRYWGGGGGGGGRRRGVSQPVPISVPATTAINKVDPFIGQYSSVGSPCFPVPVYSIIVSLRMQSNAIAKLILIRGRHTKYL